MRRTLLLVAASGTLVLGSAAFAAAPAGDLVQISGGGGCITNDGQSNGAPSDCADGRGLDGAEAVALSPDERFAYVYSYIDGTIATVARDTATGALSQAADASACLSRRASAGECGDGRLPGEGSDSAHAIAVTGSHLFMAGQTRNMIATFARDGSTGALTEPAGPDACVSVDGRDADANAGGCTVSASLTGPDSVAVSPDGRFLYAGGNGTVGLTAFAIGAGGALTPLPAPAGCYAATAVAGCTQARLTESIYDIALAPDGTSLVAATSRDSAVLAFRRDSATGALTQIAGPGGCVKDGGTGDAGNPCTAGRSLGGAQSVEVSPDGSSVSVGAPVAAGITMLRRAPDGSLSQAAGAAGCVAEAGTGGCGTSRTTRNVYRTVFTPDGRTLVAAGYADGGATSGIAVFDVAAGGALTQRPGVRGCLSNTGADSLGTAGGCAAALGVGGPVGLAMAGDGRWLYATAYTDRGLSGFRFAAAPACADASASTTFGAPVTVAVACTDADGDPVTLAGVDGPSNGTVAFSGSSVTYTPAAGFSGTDAFRVKGSDGANDSAPATVSVAVGPAPAPPVVDPPIVAPARLAPERLTVKAKPGRDRAIPYEFRFKGRLVPAPGAACAGKVVVKLKLGGRTAAKKAVPLAASCKWRATVRFSSLKKLGNRRKGTLKVKARFRGSDEMTGKAAKGLKVRFG